MTDSLSVGLVIAAAAVAAVFMRMTILEQRLRRLSRLEAKIDALMKHSGIPFEPYKDVPPAVADAVRRGKKIEAIKYYREATGADLREAKEFVEELQRRSRVSV